MREIDKALQEILEQHPVTDVLCSIIRFYDEPANFQPGSSHECYEDGDLEMVRDELTNVICSMLDTIDKEEWWKSTAIINWIK